MENTLLVNVTAVTFYFKHFVRVACSHGTNAKSESDDEVSFSFKFGTFRDNDITDISLTHSIIRSLLFSVSPKAISECGNIF